MAPRAAGRLELMGEDVFAVGIGVAGDVEGAFVVRLKDREHEAGDGVFAEIGGDVPDAQRTIGSAIVVVELDFAAQRLGVESIVFAVFGEKGLGVGVGMKVEAVEEIAVDFGVIGL